MKSFVKMGEVFGTEILSPLVSHCKGLVEDKKWRIRLACFETLHKLTVLYKVNPLFLLQLKPDFYLVWL